MYLELSRVVEKNLSPLRAEFLLTRIRMRSTAWTLRLGGRSIAIRGGRLVSTAMRALTCRGQGICLVMIIAILVTGCTSLRDWRRFGYVQGLEPALDAGQTSASTTNQEAVLLSLAHRANLRPANNDLANIQREEWPAIAEAGFNLVDEQCEKYIDALFWWNRYKRATVTELSLVGAATAAILGIADASAAAIAITAAAFGLTTATVENIGNSVLLRAGTFGGENFSRSGSGDVPWRRFA